LTDKSGPERAMPKTEKVDSKYSSENLTVGTIYTRKGLAKQFAIGDATINTGVFRPKGHASVWLFVTRNKPPSRPQYQDRLVGDTLYWQGQTSGRTDRLIIDHKVDGLELLVFYREDPDRYAEAGFRYEGIFEYVQHTGSHPTSFVLRRPEPS
jgi:hypothetical protein